MVRPHKFLVTNHSGFPWPAFAAGDVEGRGRAIRASVEAQISAGLDIVSLGHFGHLDPLTPFVMGLEGLAPGDQTVTLSAWEEIHVPIVRQMLRRTRSLFEEELTVAESVTDLPIKISFPGPYTLARLIADPDDHYDSVGGFIEALSEILAEEIRTLAGRGAAVIQLEEPCVLRRPTDFPRLREGLLPLHEAKGAAQLALMLSGGSVTPLYDWLQSLPVDILSLDLTESPGLVDLIPDRQTPLILGLGLVNLCGEEEPSVAELTEILSKVVEGVRGSTVHIHPSSDLTPLSAEVASARLTGLVAVVREFASGALAGPARP